jgi:hypothetical protein
MFARRLLCLIIALVKLVIQYSNLPVGTTHLELRNPYYSARRKTDERNQNPKYRPGWIQTSEMLTLQTN